MTLAYTKMFLIVTEEAVVKGHFTFYIDLCRARKGRFLSAWADSQCVTCCIQQIAALRRSTPNCLPLRKGRFFIPLGRVYRPRSRRPI